MFERLVARGAVSAERRARERIAATSAALGEAVPAGIAVTAEDGAVVMSGRGVGARFVRDPALRRLAAWIR